MCTNHYNRARYPKEIRHPKVAVTCAGCGAEVLKAKSNRYRPVCSDRCKYFVTYGRWPASKDLVGPIVAPRLRTAPAVESVVPSTRRGFVACMCDWCGDGFIFDWRVSGVLPATCSERCAKRRSQRRGGRFVVPDRVRNAIYERDGWRCGLCGDPVTAGLDYTDLWSATLDHIEPRSKGGSDAPENLQLAHRWCNSVINDRSELGSDFLLAG